MPTWAKAVEYMMKPRPGWVYRGQAAFSWKLVTTLERTMAPLQLSRADLRRWELRSVEFFQQHAKPVMPNAPSAEALIDWLTVMQHYRAPTRLLDWSFSPFVGTYFAFASMDLSDGGEDGALWLLNEELCREVYGVKYTPRLALFEIEECSAEEAVHTGYLDKRIRATADQGIELAVDQVISRSEAWPLPIFPRRSDARLSPQQALFTCDGLLSREISPCPTEMLWRLPRARAESPDPNFESRLRDLHRQGKVIQKVRLKREWRQDALRDLKAMNITADTLFPGLDGIGAATTLDLLAEPPTPFEHKHHRKSTAN